MQIKILKKPLFICVFLASVTQVMSCSLQKHANKNSSKSFTILGLGDSITEGGPDFFSYLFPLDSLLKANGQQHRFIGPRRSVQNTDTLYHAGFSGKTAEYLAKQIDSIYSLYPADIVLLHSGHNHFVEEKPLAGILKAQEKIIQTIRTKNPTATIFVAAVITAGKLPKYEYIPQLDAAIKKMVDSLYDTHIIFVDQSNGWNWEDYTIADKVHPNRPGAMLIARHWLDAIVNNRNKK